VLYARIGDAQPFQETPLCDFFLGEFIAEFNHEFTFEINIELSAEWSAELSVEFSTQINTKFADEINVEFAGNFTHRRIVDLLGPGAGQGRNATLCPG
jgi:hypothetical protein